MVTDFLKLSPEQIEEIKKSSISIDFKSRLSFLQDHNGFRRGKLHLVMGESGGGKSTFFKSLLVDLFKSNPNIKVGVWLSEEEKDDLVAEFSRNDTLTESITSSRIFLFSELSSIKSTEVLESALKTMFDLVDIVFMDNLTTSALYQDKPISEQSKVASGLKTLIKKFKKPMVVFAHTGGGVRNSSLTTQNDIRGSKTIVNLSEIIYMIQQLQIDDEKITTLRCVKSRGNVTKEFGYILRFNPDEMVYSNAEAQTPELFKTFLKMASKLSGVK